MLTEKPSYKKFFITYGIFIGIIILTILVLIYFVSVSKKPWQNNLRFLVEKTLNEKKEGNWIAGDFNTINNSFTMSAACYDVVNTDTDEQFKSVLIRVTSFYGPLPALYLADQNGNVEFVGFASLHGPVSVQLESKKTNKRVEYWAKKIPDIINLPVNKAVDSDLLEDEQEIILKFDDVE